MSALLALMLAQAGGMSDATVNAIIAEAEGRVATIQKLIDAMNRGDQKAFKAVGGNRVAFSTDSEVTFSALMSPRTPKLSIDSFSGLSACKAGRPQSTAVDWWTVTWQCPSGAHTTESRYSFKFAGRNLVAVQAMRHAPKVKLN